MLPLPLPNETIHDGIVVASTYGTDETALLIILMPQPPYYLVAEYDLRNSIPMGDTRWWWVEEFPNINPAVAHYVEMGGDYPIADTGEVPPDLASFATENC